MFESRLFARLEDKKERLDALRPLPAAAVNRLKEQITVEWIYNSNAIEGSTITLQETRLILETGVTIGGKSLREHFEVINHREAIVYVEDLTKNDQPITAFHVRQIHELVLNQIDDRTAGSYRQTQVLIVGASHTPPESWLVPQHMNDWADWLSDSQNDLHPIQLAAQAHHRLVAIHPFVDGNGRTARLIMNLLLMQHGYPPTVIMRTNRTQYYSVLAQADAGNPVPLVNFVGRSVERSLTLYLEACTPITTPPKQEDQWLPLREAAEDSPYSQEYLSLLARLGRLEAVKRGRNWYTTLNAVEAYRQSVKKR